MAGGGAQTGALGGRRCGTHLGYDRHHADGEPACQPCLNAHAIYASETRDRDWDRAYGRARGKALVRLAESHRAEYAALLHAERVKEGIA